MHVRTDSKLKQRRIELLSSQFHMRSSQHMQNSYQSTRVFNFQQNVLMQQQLVEKKSAAAARLQHVPSTVLDGLSIRPINNWTITLDRISEKHVVETLTIQFNAELIARRQ